MVLRCNIFFFLPYRQSSARGFLYELRRKQKQTLGWMYLMEGVLEHVLSGGEAPAEQLAGYLSTQELRRRLPYTDLEAVLRLERIYRSVGGGVLADDPGFGKTCCILALVASTRQTLRPGPEASAGLVPSSATLVVVPPNLLGQWGDEAAKFLGKDGLKVLTIKNVQALQAYSVQDFIEADLVIVPYNFLKFDSYRKHCDGLVDASPEEIRNVDTALSQFNRAETHWRCLREHAWHQFAEAKNQRNLLGNLLGQLLQPHKHRFDREWERNNARPVRENFKDKVNVTLKRGSDYQARRHLRLEALGRALARRLQSEPAAARTLKGAALELFCYKRIVFDEFHEALNLKENHNASNESLAYEAIRLLRAPRRWGLTATPKLENVADVSRMAEVLQIFLPTEQHDEAQGFLDHFVRCNSWDAAALPLEDHTIRVTLTARERALYMSEVQRHEARAGANSESNQSWSARCVQLCSHFAPDALAGDAHTAVKDTQRAQQKELAEARAKLAENERVLEQLESAGASWEERRSTSVAVGQLKRSVREVETAIRYFESTLKSLTAAVPYS